MDGPDYAPVNIRTRPYRHAPVTDPLPTPASAAWTPGQPVGQRQFAHLGDFVCENGQVIPDLVMAYETHGRLNAQGSNAVLVLHALTGDSHVMGQEAPGHPTPGWWEDMVGSGCPIDTNQHFVVSPNALGGCQGSTGPSSLRADGRQWAADFPRITTRDQVAAEIALLKHLGVTSLDCVVGASLGGLRALEWGIMGPAGGLDLRALIGVATCAQTSADQIAWAHPQVAAIRLDPGWNAGNYYQLADDHGPHRGMAIARQIAHATYRSAFEFNARFGRLPQTGEDPLAGGRYAVQSYLDYHGDKLARRFDANSYMVLTQCMLSHDVGRGRGGVDAALASVKARMLVVGVDSDRLFPPSQSQRIAAAVPGAELKMIHTPYGHDGFLVEFDQLGLMVRDFLHADTPGGH